uniref:Reverse transcriptase domain-containing protein n=1 Tax=Tricholoma bakamatsutake TaxID=51221 RepID=A0A6C0W4Z8_9AGAR|nr:hypothetical protein [Tricholoma bakamatsutake]QIC20190.1 hypothetical protein [Tricholoma bakamatsutake]
MRPLKLYGYWAQSPSPYVYLTSNIAILIYILQYDTVIKANKFYSRIAIMQCTVKEWLPFLVDGISRNFYDEVYELVTYSCNLFQWHYLPLWVKQNSMVVFEHCISQGPIGEMLSESSTALQDSNLSMLSLTLVMCASIYGNKDYKHLVYANWGTNRLGEGAISQPRTRRELSSSVIRAKGPSRNSSSKKNPDLESKKAKRENKPKDPKFSPKKAKVSEALSRIAFQTELQIKINELQKSHQKIYNLDKFYTDTNFLVSCYLMIKGKAANMSPGTNDETLDGIDLAWFERIATELKSGEFYFSPTRQVQLPKPNKPGQFRTLSVGSPRDKIIQKALQVILEAIWDSKFSDNSHGFRPGRSVHSALLPLYLKGRNYTWVIQGDISKCFDTIPHEIIMKRLSKRIGDLRFLELILKFLKAGSITKTGKYISSDIGTPQGGILTPILANIVLDELDHFVWNLIVKFEKGNSRKHNPEYNRIQHQMNKLPEEERMPLRLQLRTISYGLQKDLNFKRMMYIRYADDFVILVEGSHDEAVYCRNLIKSFLLQNCGLHLNLDKTLITNMSDNEFFFLGAEIVKLKANPSFVHRITDSLGRKSKRRGHARLLIKAPLDNLLLAIKKSGFIRQNSLGEYSPQAYTQIMNLSHYEIITFYNSKINGLLNFYAFASNYNRLRYILYLFQMSCAYTLARKYKLGNFAQAFSKFGKLLTDPETEIKLKWPDTMKVRHDYKSKNNIPKFTDIISETWLAKLTKSTFEKTCALCGTTSQIEMHHLRSVKNVRARMRTGNSTYAQWFGATQRKQVPLCSYHHHLYHNGELSAADLREISNYTK